MPPWAACAMAWAKLLRRMLKLQALVLTSKQASHLTTALCVWTRNAPTAASAACIRALGALACQHLQDLRGEPKANLLSLLRDGIPLPLTLDPLQVSKEALAALEAVLASKFNTVPQPWLADCFTALLASLHSAASNRVLVMDTWHCSSYLSQLRSLQHCMAAHDADISANASNLVDALSRFWSLSNTTVSEPNKTRYVPPHQRSSGSPSATSGSDSSGSSCAPANHGAACVRLAALSALVGALRSDASALHPLWNRLLPASLIDPTAWHVPTTLPSVLLYDHHAPCRVMAATAIHLMTSDREARLFMAVAEARLRTAAPGVRAFTSLSASLAAMLSSLHTALSSALQSEAHADARLAMLRASASLVSSTPYPRMPPGQLDSLFSAVCSLWQPSWYAIDASGGQVCCHGP
jgi:hypothetical protein